MFKRHKDLFLLAYLETVNGVPYVFTHAGLTIYWLNKVNSKVWRLSDRDISIANQDIIDRINQLDFYDAGQNMLSVIGKGRSLYRGEKTGSVLWADIDEHPIANAPKAYGLDKVLQVFGHTRIDESNSDMVSSDHLAMINSQRCFMIDENIEQKIVPILEYEVILTK